MTLGLKGTILFFSENEQGMPKQEPQPKPKRPLMSFLEFVADRKAKAQSPAYSVTNPPRQRQGTFGSRGPAASRKIKFLHNEVAHDRC